LKSERRCIRFPIDLFDKIEGIRFEKQLTFSKTIKEILNEYFDTRVKSIGILSDEDFNKMKAMFVDIIMPFFSNRQYRQKTAIELIEIVKGFIVLR